MADIDSVLASWATDNFMDGAQEEARISSSDVVTRTHIGDTVKMHFLSYYGNVSMETYTKKPVAKLLGWLAKLYISTTAAKDHLTHCRHYFLEQEWDHMSWQPRKRGFQALGSPKKGRPAFEDITNVAAAARHVVSSEEQAARLSLEHEHSQQQQSDADEWLTISYEASSGRSMHTTCRQWIDIDAADIENSVACTDYMESIMDHLFQAERKWQPLAGYMSIVQTDVHAGMRSILVDWLVQVSLAFKLVPDTLFLGVSCVDRFLSIQDVSRSQLQLVGVTCLFLASKYEEINALTGEQCSYITDNTYSKREILRMELSILKALKYKLAVPTPCIFLHRFIKASTADWPPFSIWRVQHEYLAAYITELALPEYSALQWLPSIIAAAAVLLARHICAINIPIMRSLQPWSPTLQHYSGYRPSELRECATALHAFHVKASQRAPAEATTAIYDKYAQHHYHNVAMRLEPPLELPPQLFEDPEAWIEL